MQNKTIKIAGRLYILLSALSFLYVSLMGLFSPQSVMNLVSVQLGNTDAISSIRGVYGGVGLSIVIVLSWLMWKDPYKGLKVLSLIWGLYALSRIITQLVDGALGDFGKQWLIIESIFFVIAVALLWLSAPVTKTVKI